MGGSARPKAVGALDVLALRLAGWVRLLDGSLFGVAELVGAESISIDVTVILISKQRLAVHNRLP